MKHSHLKGEFPGEVIRINLYELVFAILSLFKFHNLRAELLGRSSTDMPEI